MITKSFSVLNVDTSLVLKFVVILVKSLFISFEFSMEKYRSIKRMRTVYYMLVVIEFNFKMNYLTLFHQNLSFIFPVFLTEYFSVLLSAYQRDICLIIVSSLIVLKNLLYHVLHFRFVYGLSVLYYILLLNHYQNQ